MRCSALQCVAVRCSALQCVAVCCSALQCVAVCCSALQCVAVRCSVLQCVAVRCSVLQCVAVRCSAWQSQWVLHVLEQGILSSFVGHGIFIRERHCDTRGRHRINHRRCIYVFMSIHMCQCKYLCMYIHMDMSCMHFSASQLNTATHCNTLQHTATHCNTDQTPPLHVCIFVSTNICLRIYT